MRKRLINANELRAKLEEAIKVANDVGDVAYGAGLFGAIDKLDAQPTVKTEVINAVACVDLILLNEHPDYINSVKRDLAREVGRQLMESKMLVYRQQDCPDSRQTGFKASVRVIIPVEEVRNDDCD